MEGKWQWPFPFKEWKPVFLKEKYTYAKVSHEAHFESSWSYQIWIGCTQDTLLSIEHEKKREKQRPYHHFFSCFTIWYSAEPHFQGHKRGERLHAVPQNLGHSPRMGRREYKTILKKIYSVEVIFIPKRTLNCHFRQEKRSDKQPDFLPADLLLKGLFVFSLSPAPFLRYKELTEDHLENKRLLKTCVLSAVASRWFFSMVFTI